MTVTLLRVSPLLLGAVSLVLTPSALAQSAPAPADRAYQALQAADYPAALAAFRDAIAAGPANAHLRKDFAYALLRAGEREEARDQFAAALKIDPADHRIALEYAFLCYETRQPVQARRTFDRLRHEAAAPEEIRSTAATAFENVDRPLREGIERWQQAVLAAPGQYSAHEELARLAEQRDQIPLAAEHYREAWRLRPELRRLLLDLGRVATEQGNARESIALLLAASRGSEPHVAEAAKELLPNRYPYVYEFEEALAIDPSNLDLRREFAFLLLELKQKDAALEQLRRIGDADPLARRQLDLLTAPPGPQAADVKGVDAKTMARRSLDRSYLNDALRYYRIAHEENPSDFEVMLGLGRTYNLLGDDGEALRWFNHARRAGSADAESDYRNLRATAGRFHVTTWAQPMYSSRWSSGLFYAQVKGEWKLKRLPLRPYISMRVIADTQGSTYKDRPNPLFPSYLSETAVIPGLGVALPMKHGFFAWAEAGAAISYIGRRLDGGPVTQDYRGGVAWLRGYGAGKAMNRRGLFAETGFDTVYVSRFSGNVLTYAQNRGGYTVTPGDGAVQAQLYWNVNVTADTKREYWANFAETGPGVRVRFRGLPPPMAFRFDMLRGVYFLNRYNPLAPNFWDVRAGLWYAFTR